MTALALRAGLEWAGLPRLGERVSGDLVLLARGDAAASACVVDVAGHGPSARAAAARIEAGRPLEAGEGDPAEVVRRIHQLLSGSGDCAAAMAIRVTSRAEALSLEYCGVGNVRIAFSDGGSSDEGRPGMLGELLPTLRAWRRTMRRGDLVAVCTDGVGSELSLGQDLAGLRLRDVPSMLLRRHGRRYDDATCLALRAEET